LANFWCRLCIKCYYSDSSLDHKFVTDSLDRGTPLSGQQQEELTNHSNEVNRLEPALTRWNDATTRSDYESLARQTLNHEGLNQMMTQSMVPARARAIQQELRNQAIQERQKSIQLTRKFGN